MMMRMMMMIIIIIIIFNFIFVTLCSRFSLGFSLACYSVNPARLNVMISALRCISHCHNNKIVFSLELFIS